MAYGPADYLVRVQMEAASGLPEDRINNDFAFSFITAGSPAESDFAELVTSVNEFYESTTSSGFKLSRYLSGGINRAATHHMEIYKIAAGGLGSPVYSTTWLGPGASGGTGLPTECCGVVSFHADLAGVLEEAGATRPKSRHRGRVYVGPINSLAVQTGTPPYRLSDDFTLTMRSACNQMGDAADIRGWMWSVWSRKDEVLRPVVGGWTDNAPDILRKRGVDSNTRVTFSR